MHIDGEDDDILELEGFEDETDPVDPDDDDQRNPDDDEEPQDDGLAVLRQQRAHIRKLERELRDAIRGTNADYTRIPLRRAVFLLAVPMVLELVLESTFAVVDIFFVAKLGPSAVATVGLLIAVQSRDNALFKIITRFLLSENVDNTGPN